ncbi:MAG: methyltransferase domain-containing protein [Bacteroidia bacterium]
MDQKHIQESISYYQEKIKKFGSSAEGMDWKNADTQYLRFDILSRYIDFSRKPSVLDVGCGNGEFLNYCRSRNLDLNYYGVDAVPEMAAMVNDRFGMGTAECCEFLSWQTNRKFDFVIASGTFNAKLNTTEEVWQNYFHDNIRKMFSLALTGVVFNCMTSFVDYRYDRLYYPTVQELSELAVKELSRRFVIDHSYPLYEMTMAIYSLPNA